jgi:Inner membrane protein YgaP-like, transmembrane domain
MHTNMSNFDRVVRAGLAVAALVVAIVIGAGSVGGIVLLVLAAVMGVTATVGFCPIYTVFHFDSHRRPPLPH